MLFHRFIFLGKILILYEKLFISKKKGIYTSPNYTPSLPSFPLAHSISLYLYLAPSFSLSLFLSLSLSLSLSSHSFSQYLSVGASAFKLNIPVYSFISLYLNFLSLCQKKLFRYTVCLSISLSSLFISFTLSKYSYTYIPFIYTDVSPPRPCIFIQINSLPLSWFLSVSLCPFFYLSLSFSHPLSQLLRYTHTVVSPPVLSLSCFALSLSLFTRSHSL